MLAAENLWYVVLSFKDKTGVHHHRFWVRGTFADLTSALLEFHEKDVLSVKVHQQLELNLV